MKRIILETVRSWSLPSHFAHEK